MKNGGQHRRADPRIRSPGQPAQEEILAAGFPLAGFRSEFVGPTHETNPGGTVPRRRPGTVTGVVIHTSLKAIARPLDDCHIYKHSNPISEKRNNREKTSPVFLEYG